MEPPLIAIDYAERVFSQMKKNGKPGIFAYADRLEQTGSGHCVHL